MKILFFSTPTCGVCKSISKQVSMAAEQLVCKLELINCFDESNAELCQKYDIDTAPTLVILGNGGKYIGKLVGATTKTKIVQLAESV